MWRQLCSQRQTLIKHQGSWTYNQNKKNLKMNVKQRKIREKRKEKRLDLKNQKLGHYIFFIESHEMI